MNPVRAPVLLLALFYLGTARAEPDDEIRSRIRRQPVVSSNVLSVGYSRQLHVLEIEFSRGAIYRFLDVQPRLYRDLMAAQSKGRFIAANIRGKYRFLRVRPSRNSQKHGLTTNESRHTGASPAP